MKWHQEVRKQVNSEEWYVVGWYADELATFEEPYWYLHYDGTWGKFLCNFTEGNIIIDGIFPNSESAETAMKIAAPRLKLSFYEEKEDE